jgi:hypothetical protein
MKAQLDESEDLLLRSKSGGKSIFGKEDTTSVKLPPTENTTNIKAAKSMNFEEQGSKGSTNRDTMNRSKGAFGSEASDKYSVRSFPSPSKSKNTPRLAVPANSRSISNNSNNTNTTTSNNNNNNNSYNNINVRNTVSIEKNTEKKSKKDSKDSKEKGNTYRKDYENENNNKINYKSNVDNSNTKANKKQL